MDALDETLIFALSTVAALVLSAAAPAPAKVPVVAARSTSVLVARPAQVDFKSKHVGTENYKRTKITNTGPTAVRLLVTAGLPDDFGFGTLPGETCPVFSPGEILPAGRSCYAVVRFSPSEFFVGWEAMGSLTATATDPATTGLVEETVIPVLGRAIL